MTILIHKSRFLLYYWARIRAEALVTYVCVHNANQFEGE